MTASPESRRLIARLVIDSELGPFLGDARIRLLEQIALQGSIAKAAKAIGMSYKAAWDALDSMNNLAHAPLVERHVGGRDGGGSTLTGHGQRLVTVYRAIENEYRDAVALLTNQLSSDDAADLGQMQALLRRMSLKTSARNQFAGTVCGLRAAAVDFEVRIRLHAADQEPHDELAAIITEESAERLQLRIGSPVQALVKSSSVLLMTDREMRISARNQLWGEVIQIRDGPVNAEVTLALASGKTVTAVITHGSVERLGIALGQPACAVFKASAVILVANG